MDPSTILSTIFSIAVTIKQTVDKVKANSKKCKTLVSRMELLLPPLRGMNNLDCSITSTFTLISPTQG